MIPSVLADFNATVGLQDDNQTSGDSDCDC